MKLTQITNPVALRLDTTSGTRIFAGDTMIYGDTGWRNIGALLPGSTGEILLRRTGYVVELALNNLDNRAGESTSFVLPTGFKVGKITHTIIPSLSPSIWTLTTGLVSVGQRMVSGSAHGIWTTTDPWPTTLPGLPA